MLPPRSLALALALAAACDTSSERPHDAAALTRQVGDAQFEIVDLGDDGIVIAGETPDDALEVVWLPLEGRFEGDGAPSSADGLATTPPAPVHSEQDDDEDDEGGAQCSGSADLSYCCTTNCVLFCCATACSLCGHDGCWEWDDAFCIGENDE